MTKTSPTAGLAFVTAFVASLVSATVAAPIALADPLDGPRNAVEKARADSTCPKLNYNVDLENAAQQFARVRDDKLVTWPGYTGGNIQMGYGTGDPQSAAIDGMMSGMGGMIRDCRYKDYGVGFYRDGGAEIDYVSIALGEAKPPPAAPPIAAQPQRPRFQEVGTVIGGDLDVWDIAHNDVPDPATGVRGAKIGTLTNGSQVALDRPCQDGWCHVNSNQIPQGDGFVEQIRLQIHRLS
jgi:hypothetical protein